MIQTPKNPRDPEACFHCGQPATKVPGYAAVCPPCEKAQHPNLPRNLEILETLAQIATQHPTIRLGQILAHTIHSYQCLSLVSDSELHDRLKRYLRDNAMKDVREARKIKHEQAVEDARCPDCKCERDLHSGAGTHAAGCSYFPL